MKHYTFRISDYEHGEDLNYAKQDLLSKFPKVKNVHTYEEEDTEAEFYYKEEYGEGDYEPIYQGYIEFDAPDEYKDTLNTLCL